MYLESSHVYIGFILTRCRFTVRYFYKLKLEQAEIKVNSTEV